MKLASPAQPTSVLILGGGMAGLVAAYELQPAGYDVKIIEARDVPGGRVQTIRDGFTPGLHAEAGALFFPAHHTLTTGYARQLGVDLVDFAHFGLTSLYYVHGERIEVPPEGQPQHIRWPYPLTPHERHLGLDGMTKTYCAEPPGLNVEPMPSTWPPEPGASLDLISYTERMAQLGASEGARELLSVGYSYLFGDGPDSYSALMMLINSDYPAQHPHGLQVLGGNDGYPKAFAAQLAEGSILYGTEVVYLEQDARKVRVAVVSQGTQGTPQILEADYAICTLPFSVLRRIPVEPAFSPAKTAAIQNLKYTSVERVCLEFRDAFWVKEGLSGLALTDLPIGIVYPQPNQLGSGGILNVYLAGAEAREAARRGEPNRVQYTLNEIAKFYPQAPGLFVSGVSKTWDTDPWARGAYAWYAPGEMVPMLPAIQASEGRIYFAGDHVSSLPGWIEGALASGCVAAEGISRAAVYGTAGQSYTTSRYEEQQMSTSLRSVWPQVVGQAWADESFRLHLTRNPKAALGELGIHVPDKPAIAVLEETADVTYLVLPVKPAGLESLALPVTMPPLGTDACTPTPGACTPTPGACTPGPPDACTPGPAHACTPAPSYACTPAPSYACTPGPPDACTPAPGACTPAPGACTPTPGACTPDH